ncbi:MAG: nuclease [Saprospiraceae bacterium]|nr:nuclease [Saprospiraceae bacterium]
MIRVKYFGWAFAFVWMLTGFWACVDLEFDQPPVRELPVITPNATIAELKLKHTIGNDASRIDEDMVVTGIVVADDRSGNFFKNIVIQDETAGIAVRLEAVGLYNDFPAGSKVAVKCQGLYIGDYNGLYQLNGSPDGTIPEALIPDHVVRIQDDGAYTIQPRVVTIDELSNDVFLDEVLNTLISLEEVQFIAADTLVTYADPVNNFSENRTLEDCDANTILLRSSGYADFAAAQTPAGNGAILAIMSVFRDDRQLLIRDLTDVQFAGARCGGGGSTAELTDIKGLRDLFNAGTTAAPANKKIKGVTISDTDNGNTDGRNLFLQDATGGIVVRFSGVHSFSLGDEVEVEVSGAELSEFNGLLQVNVALSSGFKTGTAPQPAPRVATVAEVLANLESWESSLVTIKNATLSGGTNYSGSRTLADGTGSITLFTRTQASFATNALPTGQVDVTAIVSQFNTAQVIIRNTNDVVITGGGGDPELIDLDDLRALFTGATTSAPALKKIKGVVISDRINNNTTTRNVVVQDATAGIVVRFTADHTYSMGDEIEINVSGQELSEFNGLLQVNNVPNSNATVISSGNNPTPREATIADINANFNTWESTLVKIVNVTFTEGGTYSGSKNISDGTGSMALFTRSQASFAASNVPAGAVTVIGVVSDFNAAQVFIRTLADINP